jgi:uracil phosphoribosyltransferase
MPVIAVNHPLVRHKIGLLREANISTKKFRELTHEVARLLAYEATADFPLERTTIECWSGPVEIDQIAGRKVTIVPILRAGLGMLDGMMRMLPTAEVGFLGMVRNEETLEAHTYANRLPDDLDKRQCYLLDPMLATGGTLAAAIHYLVDLGADDITAITLLSAPEGIERLHEAVQDIQPPITLVTGALDERLNDQGYIVPGLGDAGDRLYGVV